MTSSSDVFILQGRHKDEYIVYAPIKGFIFLASGVVVNIIHESMSTGNWPDSLRRVESALLRPDIFDPNDRFDQHSQFEPIGLMMELTTDCNLRCAYCYADAGTYPKKLDWRVARAAIELIFNNAKKLDRPEFSIFFHGRGEPTSNWQLLQKCVDYALELSNKGPKPVFRMATNGVIGSRQIEYITKNFRTISLSLDGPEKIHNKNRRLTDGSGSFSHVFRTAQYLIANKFPFGIKAVVTAANFDNLRERVDFFQQNLPGVSVGFEPVNEFGRCKKTGVEAPAVDKFIPAMVELMHNRELSAFSYSGVLGAHHIRLMFCGALKPTFGVHADGKVVACVGVPLDKEQAALFNYGRFDESKETFIFDEAMIQRLRNLLVVQFEKCSTCFAKWNCAGDCASYRLFQETNSSKVPTRCRVNRALLREHLISVVQERGDKYDYKNFDTTGRYF